MLISNLSHFKSVNQSSKLLDGQQSNDNLLTLEISDDNTISLTQGDQLLFQKSLGSRPTGIRFSITGIPNLSVTSRSLTVNNQSIAFMAVDFGNSGSTFPPRSI